MAKLRKKKYYKARKFSSIREMTEIAVKEAGEKCAYRFKNPDGTIRDVTYREFYDTCENLGAALCERGFSDAHIACISENRYEWIVAYFTALRTAGVYVPIDKELPADDKVYLLNESDASVVFYSKKQEKFIEENRDRLPGIKLFVAIDELEGERENTKTLEALVGEGSGLDKSFYDSLLSDENDLKMLVYTSGTTGVAKGVMLTEHNLVSSVYYGLQVSQIFEVGLSVLPYNHTYEAVCDILVSHHVHSTLCICSGLKEVTRELKLYKPDYIYLVPAFAEFMYATVKKVLKKEGKEETFEKGVKISRKLLKVGIDMRGTLFEQLRAAFGGNLKKIVCGGAPIRPEIGEFFGDIGIFLIGGYGITECSPLVSVNDEKRNDYATAGSKLPCLDVRIDEPNEEGIGEICVKGDVVMKGYYKMPEKTEEVLKDGWFYTGDYGYITEDENIVITGRKKNIIVLSNGKNVYPEEIEEYIKRIEYITEAVVKGVKNENGDETALAAELYIAPENGEHNEKDVLDDIRKEQKELPGYKKISSVIIRSEPFEKTTSNKIKRH